MSLDFSNELIDYVKLEISFIIIIIEIISNSN